MGYIESGKKEGATVHSGGARHGTEGYFIQPTIFTDTTPNMRIVREEIFGPVGVVIKFDDEEDVIRQANDTGTPLSPFSPLLPANLVFLTQNTVSPLPSSRRISTVPSTPHTSSRLEPHGSTARTSCTLTFLSVVSSRVVLDASWASTRSTSEFLFSHQLLN